MIGTPRIDLKAELNHLYSTFLFMQKQLSDVPAVVVLPEPFDDITFDKIPSPLRLRPRQDQVNMQKCLKQPRTSKRGLKTKTDSKCYNTGVQFQEGFRSNPSHLI